MDYIGSKQNLNPWIFSCISEHLERNPNEYVFLDACSGSGAVSRYAAQQGFRVISNDLLHFASVVVNGSIGARPRPDLIERLNKLQGISGFFYTHFSEASGRNYFTASNASKLDAAREFIDTIDDRKTRDYLLYCCLEAMSRVINTAGVQAAYLKDWKDRSLAPIIFEPEPVVDGCLLGAITGDILTLLPLEQADILYIDPPYNHRQYAPNYHLYETFVLNDTPELSGKTGLRNWKQAESLFCKTKECSDFLQRVLQENAAPLVALSYNSDGLLSSNEIRWIFQKADMSVVLKEMPYRRFKSDASTERRYNDSELQEYLFIAER